MGCDIHAHVEIKVNGQWHHYNHPSANRRYALFSRMANVRNSGRVEPISQPRGLPDDVTFMTKFDRDRWQGDAHSDSWLSAEEIAALDKWMKEGIRREYPSEYYNIESDFGYIFGNGWDVKKYPREYPAGLEDVRLVFWFDN